MTIGGVTLDPTVATNVSRLTFRQDQTPTKLQVIIHTIHVFQKQIYPFHFSAPLQVNEPHIIGLRADLKDLSNPGAFRAAVRRCLLAGEL